MLAFASWDQGGSPAPSPDFQRAPLQSPGPARYHAPMPSVSDALRAYIAARPFMFLRIEVGFEGDLAVADVRCGYREGPAPWWRAKASEGGDAIERAAYHALNYWAWRQTPNSH